MNSGGRVCKWESAFKSMPRSATVDSGKSSNQVRRLSGGLDAVKRKASEENSTRKREEEKAEKFDVSQVQKLSVGRCAFQKVQKDGRRKRHGDRLMVRRCVGEEQNGERRTFLSLEEAGLVEMTGLSSHERFLCRLTISSLNLLRVISEQEGCPIEELNAGKVCDWFVKDRLKREQNIESAVLQWDESEFQL
ncbi:hypothetical protein H6P81_005685 [Aristolochia fimbriata]|uniref:Receptor-interacting protein n=1 Tax=Aristolochia fimbriata TaxID=158543 RepID=A0AAV7EW94_ARIFI|nr:hypothetical protein H6P81_005685 [Aristolochia fimbriata]